MTPELKEKVRRLPDRPGVYLMKDRLGRIIYVGKAISLKKRASTYFQPSRARVPHPKIRVLSSLIEDIEWIEVRSEPEALLLEGRLIKQYHPRYNSDFTDDKRFPLIRVDLAAPLPRFTVVRFRRGDGARYFGPYAGSGPMRKTLEGMRRRFGILLADARPRACDDGRWKLHDDIRAEMLGHPNLVTTGEYRERVDAAIGFLEGRSLEWLVELRAKMQEAAENRDFEKAAGLRDMVFALEETLAPARRFERERPLAPAGDEALASLQEALGLPRPPRRIECFDISHISGTFVVASMVHFQGGRPDRRQHRRYRIRSFEGNDDFRAMEEVVGRRYRRLRDAGEALPDLVVIDGGAGQVGAALHALESLGITPPALIGLAKRHETVIFPGERPPLQLPPGSPGLQLLQRVRDEAHRHANTYSADLRSRRMRESILDEVPGLGPVRRSALLAVFGSIERIRAATVAELCRAPGVGPVLAGQIRAFLSAHRPAGPAGG